MDLDYHTGLAMDFQNLISCIQCHEDSTNLPIIIETLNTIVDICTNEEMGKDAFRDEGGLEFLMELVSTTDSTLLLEHVLKALALVIVENVHSQMLLSKKEYFLHFHAIIKRPSFPPALLKNTLLLLSSIMFQNGLAQNLIVEDEFLQDLLIIYENAAPSLMSHSFVKSPICDSSSDLFLGVNSVLCFAVNNPQNEKNQDACSALFPLTLKLLESSPNVLISNAVSSFLSLCIADNRNTQQKFTDRDGLLVLKRSFQKLYDNVESDLNEFNYVASKCIPQSLNNLIGVITAVVCENSENATFLGQYGIITLMMKLLIIGLPDNQLQIRIMLALAYCIDAHANCKYYVLKMDNFDIFLKNNLQNENQEVVSASKYLLQVCLNKEGDPFETDLGFENQASFPLMDNRYTFSKDTAGNQSSPSKRSFRAKPLSIASCSKFSTCSTSRRAPKPKDIDSKSKENNFFENFPPPMEKKLKHTSSKYSIISDKLQHSRGRIKSADDLLSSFVSDSQKYWGQIEGNKPDCIKKYKHSKKKNFSLLKDVQSCKSFRKAHSKKSSYAATVSDSSAVHFNFPQKKSLRKRRGSRSDMSNNKLLTPGLLPKNLSKTIYKADHKKISDIKLECSSVMSEIMKLNPSPNAPNVKRKFNFLENSTAHNKVNDYSLNRSINIMDSISQTSDNAINQDSNSSFTRNNAMAAKELLLNERKENEGTICPNSFGEFKQVIDSSSESQESFDFNPSIRSKIIRPDGNSLKNKRKSVKRKYSRDASIESKLRSPEKSFVSIDECESYMQVLIFPGENCEQHKLISSFEMLKVVPAKKLK